MCLNLAQCWQFLQWGKKQLSFDIELPVKLGLFSPYWYLFLSVVCTFWDITGIMRTKLLCLYWFVFLKTTDIFSIEKELKIKLHRHCSSKNWASYFRCASSHSSDGLHFKPTALFLNCWICAGPRLSSALKVKCVSELGLYKHCCKDPSIPAFRQALLVFGEDKP